MYAAPGQEAKLEIFCFVLKAYYKRRKVGEAGKQSWLGRERGVIEQQVGVRRPASEHERD
jgi:hypothetical protein